MFRLRPKVVDQDADPDQPCAEPPNPDEEQPANPEPPQPAPAAAPASAPGPATSDEVIRETLRQTDSRDPRSRPRR